MEIVSFVEAQDFLYNALPVFHRQGPAAYKADIGNIKELMQYVGNPHQGPVKFIHLAGTNGKGSVTHLIAGYLQQAGYKVGVYTSPHYIDVRERIKINGALVSEASFVRLLNAFMPVIESVKPSFFEIICAMAFLYFQEEEVDFAVIETGMGGRLDSTNIITPVLSIITNISMDHQHFLGNTIEEIASEKAGIIKNGVPVIIGEWAPETEGVFREKAGDLIAPLAFTRDHVRCTWQGMEGIFTRFFLQSEEYGLNKYLDTVLHGIFQEKNIATFVHAIHVLATQNKIAPVNLKDVEIVLKTLPELTHYIGRWQVLASTPHIILDSAHNIAGIQQAADQLKHYQYKKLYVIFGTVADKNVAPVLRLLPREAFYIWTAANIPRAMQANELEMAGLSEGLQGTTSETIADAISHIREHAGNDDLILITGSIFVVGEALSLLLSSRDDQFLFTKI